MLAGQNPKHHLDALLNGLTTGPGSADLLEQIQSLRDQAERCRRLAAATYDRETRTGLRAMAEGFDRAAEELVNKRTR